MATWAELLGGPEPGEKERSLGEGERREGQARRRGGEGRGQMAELAREPRWHLHRKNQLSGGRGGWAGHQECLGPKA